MPIDPHLDAIGTDIISAAIKIHSQFGPGLLESAYKACLAQELANRGRSIRMEVALPIIFEGSKLEAGYRIDILVDELVIVELKAVDTMHPIFEAQLLTYLRLSGLRLGYLLNFNVKLMKEGIYRRVI